MKALGTVATIIALTAAPLFAETGQEKSATTCSEQEASGSAQACAGKVAETGKPDPDDASKADQKSGTSQSGSSGGRMFGVLPNYSTVERATTIDPIDARLKFKMASLNTFDPYVYPFVGLIATLRQEYGPGLPGYLKQYAASFTDNTVGNFMTTAVLPSVLHQDPRYFERGSGGLFRRVSYAASRSVITRSDSGHAQFNVSEIGGNAIAAGISNAYYPSAERTLSGTLSRWGMQVMWDTLSNELKEFWPDIRRKIHHR